MFSKYVLLKYRATWESEYVYSYWLPETQVLAGKTQTDLTSSIFCSAGAQTLLSHNGMADTLSKSCHASSLMPWPMDWIMCVGAQLSPSCGLVGLSSEQLCWALLSSKNHCRVIWFCLVLIAVTNLSFYKISLGRLYGLRTCYAVTIPGKHNNLTKISSPTVQTSHITRMVQTL